MVYIEGTVGAINNHNNGDSSHVMYREFQVLRQNVNREIEELDRRMENIQKDLSKIKECNSKIASELTRLSNSKEFENIVTQNKNKIRLAFIYAGIPTIASLVTFTLTKFFS